MKRFLPSCAVCSIPVAQRICRNPNGRGPVFCPTTGLKEPIFKASPSSWSPETLQWARESSLQERAGYVREQSGLRPAKTRLEEIAEFARRMGFHRLGLAFCSGLTDEARVTSLLLEAWGFEVASVVCKAGCVDKSVIDIPDSQKLRPGQHESMCHPMAQAEILNHCRTSLNIILGLCVGHDSAFMRYSEAPVTVLATKDRVMGHNAMAAIYTASSYYRNMQPNRDMHLEGDNNDRQL